MSNKTDLQALNANYETLIEELRGKAVGGGGGSVETCAVEIDNSLLNYTGIRICYTAYQDGRVQTMAGILNGEDYFTINNVVKDTVMICITPSESLNIGLGLSRSRYSGGVSYGELLYQYVSGKLTYVKVETINVTGDGSIELQ